MTKELIINLHGIGPPRNGVAAKESFYWVSHQTFIMLLESIVAAQLVSNLPVAITFDDGNMSDAGIALPELRKLGLKASFFICAGRIGATHYLDQIALRELLAAGMEIGTHGMDHRDWRTVDDLTLQVEVVEARRRLEDVCGKAVTKAAIPFGSYDRRVLKRLRREKFECVYTSDGGLARSEAWLKPRVTMNGGWLEADIGRTLTSHPSLRALLRRDLAMLYKSLR